MAIHLQSFPNIILSYKLLFILSVCAWFRLHYGLNLQPPGRHRRRRRRADTTNAAAHSGASGRFRDQMSRSTSLLVVLTLAPDFFILD